MEMNRVKKNVHFHYSISTTSDIFGFTKRRSLQLNSFTLTSDCNMIKLPPGRSIHVMLTPSHSVMGEGFYFRRV